MKLKTLAIAIALGAMPFAAQAELKISGDISVGYFGDATGGTSIKENGSEINIDASETVGGTTFYGHTEIDFQGTGNAAQFQEVRVGAKGAWGEVILGDADNGCGQLDVGGYPDVWFANNQGGCKGSGDSIVLYKRSMGAATVAVSHNPNDGSEHSAIGIQGKVGPVKASLGYESGDDLGDNDKNVVLGLAGSFGPVSVGLRANKADAYDNAAIGVNAAYKFGPHKVYGGFGQDSAETDRWSVGYNRSLGSNTTFVAEFAESDGDSDTSYGIGLKHAF